MLEEGLTLQKSVRFAPKSTLYAVLPTTSRPFSSFLSEIMLLFFFSCYLRKGWKREQKVGLGKFTVL